MATVREDLFSFFEGFFSPSTFSICTVTLPNIKFTLICKMAAPANDNFLFSFGFGPGKFACFGSLPLYLSVTLEGIKFVVFLDALKKMVTWGGLNCHKNLLLNLCSYSLDILYSINNISCNI